MRNKVFDAIVGGALATLVLGGGTAAAAGATVILERGGSSCTISPGDLPGLTQEFQLQSSTVVIAPNGDLVVTCTGTIPAGMWPLPETLSLTVTCTGDTGTTSGRLVATKGGRMAVMCRFPA